MTLELHLRAAESGFRETASSAVGVDGWVVRPAATSSTPVPLLLGEPRVVVVVRSVGPEGVAAIAARISASVAVDWTDQPRPTVLSTRMIGAAGSALKAEGDLLAPCRVHIAVAVFRPEGALVAVAGSLPTYLAKQGYCARVDPHSHPPLVPGSAVAPSVGHREINLDRGDRLVLSTVPLDPGDQVLTSTATASDGVVRPSGAAQPRGGAWSLLTAYAPASSGSPVLGVERARPPRS